MGKPSEKLKRFLFIIGITGVFYAGCKYLLPLVVPFFVAWVLALWLEPSAKWLSDRLWISLPCARLLRKQTASGRCSTRSFHVPIGICGVIELLAAGAVCGILCCITSRYLLNQLGMFLSNLPSWIDQADRVLTSFCHQMECRFGTGENHVVRLVRTLLRSSLLTARSRVMPCLVSNSMAAVKNISGILLLGAVLVIATGLFLEELDQWRAAVRHSLFHAEFRLIFRRLTTLGKVYIRTQLIILVITIALCTLTFALLGSPYFVLAGIGIGLFDAIPFLGVGTILVPWAAIRFFQGHGTTAVTLLALYLVCYFLRQYLETHLMSDRLGLSPLQILMSMYLGLRLFGISGLLTGPLAWLLISDLTPSIKTTDGQTNHGTI